MWRLNLISDGKDGVDNGQLAPWGMGVVYQDALELENFNVRCVTHQRACVT